MNIYKFIIMHSEFYQRNNYTTSFIIMQEQFA